MRLRALTLAALFPALLMGHDTAAQEPTGKGKSDPRVGPAKGAVAVRMSVVSTKTDARERAEACVTVEGESGNIKVDSLTLAVDGVRVTSRPPEVAARRSRTGEECNPSSGAVFDVDLLPGPNRFQAVAYATDNTASADTTVLGAKPVPGAKLYVLTVGINAYPGALHLSYARDDALAFADSLRTQAGRLFDSVLVFPLLDSAATKGAIDKQFGDLGDIVRPNDTFVFFYAGHGTIATVGADTAFYLALAAVTDLKNGKELRPHGIQAGELQLWLRRIAASSKLLVLDACNSGEMSEYYSRSNRGEVLLADFSKATRAGILAATRPSAPAVESSARESGPLGRGLFTAALLSYSRKPDERPRIRLVRHWSIAAEEMFATLAENVAQRPSAQDPAPDFPILVR